MKNISRDKIQTWFITGASSGVGKLMAQLVADRGYNVIAVARRVPQIQGDNVLCLSCDVTDEKQVEQAVQAGIQRFGRIDVLANNAGKSMWQIFEDTTTEQMHDIMNLNYFGTWHTCKALVPHFRKNGHGTIINNSSQSGINAQSFSSGYCSSKHAIEGLTGNLWLELANFCRVMVFEMSYFSGTGIRENIIASNESELPEYQGLRIRPNQIISENNDVAIAVKHIIDTAEQEKLPRRMMLGRDCIHGARCVAKDLIRDARKSRKYLECSKRA